MFLMLYDIGCGLAVEQELLTGICNKSVLPRSRETLLNYLEIERIYMITSIECEGFLRRRACYLWRWEDCDRIV
jgi:hypothetical protein